MRVALVHDWLVSARGGERVLEAICELFPSAEVFTLIHQPGSVPATIEAHRIHTSFLQHIPGIHRRYRHFLPLFPAAIESLDLRGFPLVISSSHCVAKGVRPEPGARHLCYLHAPMRYMWDRFDDYFGAGRASLPVRVAAAAVRPALQRWDRASAHRVDRFVANSRHIAQKVQALYGRPAEVVYPPVNLERFAISPREPGDYFLWMGALAPYKRVDLAVEAFRILGLPLWIAGSGQEQARLTDLPPHVKWLGRVSDEQLPALYRNARALIFPGEEDFGITPLEAQASGRPVIALARGGALETVLPTTGVFFQDPEVGSLVEAVRRFESWEPTFRAEDARAQAARFTQTRFQAELTREVDALLAARSVAA